MPTVKNASRAGRRPHKRQQIVRELSRMIVDGKFQPGSRLPSQIELQQNYGTGTVTVQQAMNRLAEDGFIFSEGARGTFVSPHPPHLTHFGVMFPEDPIRAMVGWSHFWEVILRQVKLLPTRADRKLRCYYDARVGKSSRDYPKLLDDLKHHRLAGLIFVTPPFEFRDSPLMTDPDVPCVAIMDTPMFESVPVVTPDYRAFLDEAVGYLASQGRKRIAILGCGPLSPQLSQHYQAALRRSGMTTQPYWTQHTMMGTDTGAPGLVHLLLAHPDDRPDALIVMDDNLVPAATEGVRLAGIRVPEELSIVGHCNYPFPTSAQVPVTRLGFDVEELLQLCINLLVEQRAHHTVQPMTLLKPRYENGMLTDGSTSPSNKLE